MPKILMHRNTVEQMMAEATDRLVALQDDVAKLRAINADLLAALEKAAADLDAVAFNSNNGIASAIRAAIARATQS